MSGESKFLWQSYGLASTINEYFCSLHNTPPLVIGRYRGIYRKVLNVKNLVDGSALLTNCTNRFDNRR